MKTAKTFRERYKQQAIPALQKQLDNINVHAVPRVMKVVVSAGVGRAARDPKELDIAVKTLEHITGQKPIRTTAKKSIANFKIRQGMPIGAKVTLRGKRMEHFLEKLAHAALPRVRDFQGLSPDAFDAAGSYTIGIKEHLVFPEISSESVDKLHGLAVTIVTTARTKQSGLTLLASLGFPFQTRP